MSKPDRQEQAAAAAQIWTNIAPFRVSPDRPDTVEVFDVLRGVWLHFTLFPSTNDVIHRFVDSLNASFALGIAALARGGAN